MKIRLIVMALCMVQGLFAESLVAKDGTIFKNVAIVSADPVRMLIVHDGGGSQIDYADLVPDGLSPQQRNVVAEKLTEHTERKARHEQLKLEQEAFELAQQKKGLILFERNWMKPVEREDILARRELQKFERERMSLELETQKVELRKQQALAEQNKQLLEPPRQTYYYYSYPRRHHSSPKHYRSGRGLGCRSTGRGDRSYR